MTKLGLLVLLTTAACLASAITVPGGGGQMIHRRQIQPSRPVRLHRSGPVPVIRVRKGPVKRIYVPMKVVPPPQRYGPNYKLGPPPPQGWKPHQPVPAQPYRHVPHSLGPPRKARHPKPKYSQKPSYKYSHKLSAVPYESYKPSGHQPPYVNSAVATDSYGAPKPNSYKIQSTTYGKPHPQGSPEPPKKLVKDDSATSYINVYQGDKTKDEGKPTYGFTQTHSHSYEKKHKGSVYDSDALVSNHRPVYKHKSDTISSQTTTEGTSGQGSFQPPKQTYGFQPYEDNRRDAEGFPTQPAQQYYKKQPDSVLPANYFEQGKS